jgi:hypothetical protein
MSTSYAYQARPHPRVTLEQLALLLALLLQCAAGYCLHGSWTWVHQPASTPARIVPHDRDPRPRAARLAVLVREWEPGEHRQGGPWRPQRREDARRSVVPPKAGGASKRRPSRRHRPERRYRQPRREHRRRLDGVLRSSNGGRCVCANSSAGLRQSKHLRRFVSGAIRHISKPKPQHGGQQRCARSGLRHDRLRSGRSDGAWRVHHGLDRRRCTSGGRTSHTRDAVRADRCRASESVAAERHQNGWDGLVPRVGPEEGARRARVESYRRWSCFVCSASGPWILETRRTCQFSGRRDPSGLNFSRAFPPRGGEFLRRIPPWPGLVSHEHSPRIGAFSQEHSPAA